MLPRRTSCEAPTFPAPSCIATEVSELGPATRARRPPSRAMADGDVIEVVVTAPPMGCTITLSDSGKLCEVEAVEEGSRAAGAGVEVGDVLLSANGAPPPIDLESEAALVRFFRGLRYPLRLAFARRCGAAPCGKPLELRHIEVVSADFWTDRFLSSSSRSTVEESGPICPITRTLKSY